MDMDWFHEHEKDLKEELESINPNNKALNICYSSTHEAIESYLSAILYEIKEPKQKSINEIEKCGIQ